MIFRINDTGRNLPPVIFARYRRRFLNHRDIGRPGGVEVAVPPCPIAWNRINHLVPIQQLDGGEVRHTLRYRNADHRKVNDKRKGRKLGCNRRKPFPGIIHSGENGRPAVDQIILQTQINVKGKRRHKTLRQLHIGKSREIRKGEGIIISQRAKGTAARPGSGTG